MMKKILILLLAIISSSVSSYALDLPAQGDETYTLKLRASYHTEFLRIVVEGDETVISRGLVNQKGKDISVKFTGTRFILDRGKIPIKYKQEKDSIVFSTGGFRELRVFSLKYPSRLVMDVLLDSKKKESRPKPGITSPKMKTKESEPMLMPELLERPQEIHKFKAIVVDPGHGGYDAGITTETNKEKNVVLDIARRLKALINRDASRGILTRNSDQSMSLSERVKLAVSSNSEIFLSIHIGKHKGIVLYTPVITESSPPEVKPYLTNKGQEDFMVQTAILRTALFKALSEDFGSDMVSSQPLPYSILSKIEGAALIIEMPSFETADYVAEFKTKFANSIYKGLYLYEEKTSN